MAAIAPATDEERRHGFFVLGRRHRERVFGVLDLLDQFVRLPSPVHSYPLRLQKDDELCGLTVLIVAQDRLKKFEAE